MYISGGSNVYPLEIEEVIRRHPAIAEAAVVGMPDPVWGEIGTAVCVLREGQMVDAVGVTDWLRDKVASYKIPRKIHFWEALPRSAYGKVTKAELRARLQGYP